MASRALKDEIKKRNPFDSAEQDPGEHPRT